MSEIILNTEERMLIELNTFIHRKNLDYHLKHIKLTKKYALLIKDRLEVPIDTRKLIYVALAHDLLKEKCLKPGKQVTWRDHVIPQDTNLYVRNNLDVLAELGLEDYFNSSCQFHALAAGIFLYKEFHITDPEILYPVMFHSCPIIPVYETLDNRTKVMVDIIGLADKLSSNYLRINFRGVHVKIDLDLVVFGENGNEFNYSLGLYLARLLALGKSEEEEGVKATEYYLKRLEENNPFLFENLKNRKLGGSKEWPQRKSKALKIQ